jgi:plastocyanin
MKLFTRIMAVAAILAMPLAPVLAANITITVGDNYYRGPGNTGDADIRTINVGDVVTWNFVGQSQHPTASDNGAWATFTTNRTITFNTVGTFPYHCEAHGAPGAGQYGILTVRAVTSATLDPAAAGISLSVYPNPSHGLVTVKLDQKPGTDYKLRLSSIIGQEVRTIALKPELTAAGLPLDLSDLHAGLYIYSLLVDGKVVSTKRLVLQN